MVGCARPTAMALDDRLSPAESRTSSWVRRVEGWRASRVSLDESLDSTDSLVFMAKAKRYRKKSDFNRLAGKRFEIVDIKLTGVVILW